MLKKKSEHENKKRKILAKRSNLGLIGLILAPLAGIALLITFCFTDLWQFGVVIMSVFVIAEIIGALAYIKTPRIIAEIDGDELILYRVKNEPLRVKAQDIVAANNISWRQYYSFSLNGSVMIELTNGEKLYYHSIIGAYDLVRNIETWKHAQMVNQLNELKQPRAIVEENRLMPQGDNNDSDI